MPNIITTSIYSSLLILLSGGAHQQCCSAFTNPTTSYRKNKVLTQSSQQKNKSVSSSSSSALALSFFSKPVAAKEIEIPSIPEPSKIDALAQITTDVGILALRVGTCSLMLHHGIDKVQNVDGFSANVVAKFFGFLPGNPLLWTYSAAFTQIGGAFLLSVGILSRPVALSMMGTMVAAVTFHLLNTGPEGFPLAVVAQHSYNYELAAMYVCVLAYFSAAGAGVYSVDEQVLGGELDFYNSLIDKAFNGGSGGNEE